MIRSATRASLAALLAVASCGSCAFCGEEPEAEDLAVPAVQAPVSSRPVAVVLAAAQGDVEVRHGTHGPWSKVQVPLPLGLDHSVRTAVGSTATLKVGRDGSIEVRERTEVSVRQLLVDRARFRLERGRIGATPGHTAIAIESSGSSAVAEASTGSFAVFNDGKGLVAVVAEAGEKKLPPGRGGPVVAAGAGARGVSDRTSL